MRTTLTMTLLLLCLNIGAQQLFTDKLQNGKVVLHQSSHIADLVNGKSVKPIVIGGTSDITIPGEENNDNIVIHHTGQRVKMNGFRIQIYAGGNSRMNKQQAESAAQKAHEMLPDESVYTNFISPRWVCRIGDYRSYEEAYNVLKALQEAGGFGDAVIVKSKVQVYVD